MNSEVLIELGLFLKAREYEFTTVTPATHQRILDRISIPCNSLRDVFGWNRPFHREAISADAFDLLRSSGCLAEEGDHFRSQIRFSTVDGLLLMHSAFPTTRRLDVFFGPDTYRFFRAISHIALPLGRALEVGCGTGAVGLHLKRCGHLVTLSDLNPECLEAARINAKINSVDDITIRASDLFQQIPETFDLILCNAPFMSDPQHRMYRDGGGALGSEWSSRFLRESLSHLNSGGTLLLYTGSAISDGRDHFRDQAIQFVSHRVRSWSYEEVDPDIFGEELEKSGYERVDRIAAVLLKVNM